MGDGIIDEYPFVDYLGVSSNDDLRWIDDVIFFQTPWFREI